jgi:hypothetical protein
MISVQQLENWPDMQVVTKLHPDSAVSLFLATVSIALLLV